MKSNVFRQIAVVLSLVGMVTINALANIVPFNGQTTGEISDRYPVLFTPAGYVFSIWGLIYLLLGAYVIFQALPAQRDNPRLKAVGWMFVLSSLANSAWIVAWHENLLGFALLEIVILLATLIIIYRRLGYGIVSVPAGERWLAQLPFSVYLGWVTVATIANTTILLYDLGWNGFGISPEIWTVIVFIVVMVLAGQITRVRRDAALLLVFVWALVGIAQKQSAVPLVSYAALGSAAVIAGFAAASLWRRFSARVR